MVLQNTESCPDNPATEGDGTLVCDEAGRILDADDRACQLTGYSAEELLRKSIGDLVPQFQSIQDGQYPKMLHGETSLLILAALRRKNGSAPPISLKITRSGTSEAPRALLRLRPAESPDPPRNSLETQFRRIFDAASDPTFMVDPSGRIVQASAQVEPALGYRKEEIEGQPFEVLMPERLRASFERSFRNYVSGFPAREPGAGEELMARRRDGTEFPVEILLSPLLTPEALLVSAAIRDVTDRRHAFLALRDSEAKLRHLLDELPIALWTTDRDLVVTCHTGRLAGSDPIRQFSTYVGKSIAQIPPPGHPALSAHREALLGRSGRYFRQLGDRTFKVHVEPQFDAERRIVGTVGAAIEITELRQTEERLRSSESRLQQAEMISGSGNWELDVPSGKGILSPGLYRLTGLDPSTFDSSLEGLLALVHPADQERVRQLVSRTIRESVPFVTEFRLVRSNATEIVILARGEVVQSDGGKPVRIAGTAQDITDRKRAEQEIYRLNSSLEARVKERTAALEAALQEMEAFTYAVAHDLRAPLRALHGISNVLGEDYASRPIDHDGRELIRRIQDSTRRMDDLIQAILSYASLRYGEIPIQCVDFRSLAMEVLASMSDEIQSRRGQVVLEEGAAKVLANRILLGQALVNFISNALKFVAPGVAPIVHIFAQSRAEKVRLCVQDQGIGIAPEYLERLFGMFQRLNRQEAYPGTGIGLALVRRAVERMHGEVGVTSEPGRGSTFFIELPKAV